MQNRSFLGLALAFTFLFTSIKLVSAEFLQESPVTDSPEIEIFWLDRRISEVVFNLELVSDPETREELLQDLKILLFDAVGLADIESVVRLLGILEQLGITADSIVHPRSNEPLLEYALRDLIVHRAARNKKEELANEDRAKIIKIIAQELAAVTGLSHMYLLQNSTILHEAVRSANRAMVNAVLEYGLPLLTLRVEGQTPLELAMSISRDVFRTLSFRMRSITGMFPKFNAQFPMRDYEYREDSREPARNTRLRWESTLAIIHRFNSNEPIAPVQVGEREESSSASPSNEYADLMRDAGLDPASSVESMLAILRANSAIGSHIEEVNAHSEMPDFYEQLARDARRAVGDMEHEPQAFLEIQENNSQINETQIELPELVRPHATRVFVPAILFDFAGSNCAKA